jgi:imidazoleglycerol-phosphate dehydratase
MMLNQHSFKEKIMKRHASINRKTKETGINLDLTIDGSGENNINTGVPFLDHMLDLFSKHGLFDLKLKVDGDTEIDDHHSVEDIGICLGQAFREAIGDGSGITRYASISLPMDEALAQISLDLCNRTAFCFPYEFEKTKVGTFDTELVHEFFNAFANNARLALHIDIIRGSNVHHIIEGIFKGFGVCLDRATVIDPRKKGIPSTKGIL